MAIFHSVMLVLCTCHILIYFFFPKRRRRTRCCLLYRVQYFLVKDKGNIFFSISLKSTISFSMAIYHSVMLVLCTCHILITYFFFFSKGRRRRCCLSLLLSLHLHDMCSQSLKKSALGLLLSR